MSVACPEYVIRAIEEAEIPQLLEIWKETDLNIGIESIHTWQKIDPGCSLVAVTPSGEVIGSCSAARTHEDLYFFGYYVVKKNFRGKGIGMKLWKSCMERTGDKNAAVIAVPENFELYRDRGGFPVEETEWLTSMYEIRQHVDPSPLTDNIPGIKVVKILPKDLPKVIEYDSAVVGFRREIPISHTVQETGCAAFVAVNDTAEENVRGYGVLKMTIHGNAQVGPLYADNQEIAEVLLRNMMLSLPNACGLLFFGIDHNYGAERIAQKLGVPLSSKFPRLYKNRKVSADLSKIYGQLDPGFSPY